MTATTTIQESRPLSRRPALAQLAFVLAGAAVGVIATIAVTDSDNGSVATHRPAAAVSSASSAHMSADATEAWSVSSGGTRTYRSADAMERAAAVEEAEALRACTYSATPPDVVERCLNGG